MALLNPPQSVPAVMRVILEAVCQKDAPFSDVESLVDALAPGDFGGERGGVIRDSLAALRTLNLVETTTSEGIVARETVCSRLDHRGSLRGVWSGLLLEAALEHETADSWGAEESPTRGVRDLVYGLTWVLAQDAAGPSLAWNPGQHTAGVQNLQVRQLGARQTAWPFSNDTRFRTMARWATALGLAVPEVNGLRPLPLRAVKHVVRGMVPGDRSVARFLGELGERLPVLWPGRYRDQLTSRLEFAPDPDAAEEGVASATALALLALEEERLIKLKALADAERLTIGASSKSPRRVSHVEVMA